MNRITKEDIYDLIMKKARVNELREENINEVVNDIYNLDIEEVIPLNKTETFIFRRRYGVLSNGVPVPVEYLSKETDLSFSKIRKILELIFFKLHFRIIKDNSNEPKMNSLDINENKDEYINTSISSLNINSTIKTKLIKSFIFNLKELMECSIIEIKKILGPKELEELINYLHSLNIKFLDELTREEKKEIFDMSNENTIYNSNIYWIESINNISINYLKKMQINNIKSLIINLNYLPDLLQKNIIEEFGDLISGNKKL